MGTSLTGLTPATTYDALIKVGDNGPLSATAKVLSDGLGNDSPLAMSTTLVGIGTATPDARLSVKSIETNAKGITILGRSDDIGTIRFFNSASTSEQGGIISTATSFGLMYNDVTRLHITAATGNVGIGTTSPTQKLSIADSGATGVSIASSSSQAFMNFTSVNTAGFEPFIGFGGTSAGDQSQMIGIVNGGVRWTTAGAERMRITSDGFLRMASGTGGIQFNGDTAAANALDDYEEGTFTGTLTPSTSGSIVLSSATQPFQYTKIGRQVTINGLVVISSLSSPVGLRLQLGGLPFTTANAANARGGGAVTFFDASASYAFTAVNGYSEPNQSYVLINFDSSTLATGDEFAFTFTYFV